VVFQWFTLETIAEAKEMGWDETLQQLISQDRIDLKLDPKCFDFAWCIQNEKPTKIDLTKDTPVDMDNMSLPSFQMIGDKATVSHPAGPTTQVLAPPTQSAPNQLTCSMTVTLDDLTSNSMIATHLSALRQIGNSSFIA